MDTSLHSKNTIKNKTLPYTTRDDGIHSTQHEHVESFEVSKKLLLYELWEEGPNVDFNSTKKWTSVHYDFELAYYFLPGSSLLCSYFLECLDTIFIEKRADHTIVGALKSNLVMVP